MPESIDVSIIVPTFRRVELLPDLIGRCFRQTGLEGVRVETVIVDNCPQHSAKTVVERLRTAFGPSLRYISQTRPGVSQVRNAGVYAARGRHLAFIDDDEIPAENWLATMLACRNRHGADVVLGPVFPIFPGSATVDDPLLIKLFTQSSDCPAGTVIRPISVSSVLLRRPFCYRAMATNNVLLDRSRCMTSRPPFDPALGASGGEDVLFFHNLSLTGRKIVWCPEAAVFERIPRERLATGYLLRKRYRNGQVTSFTCVMTTPRQYPRLAIAMAVGLAQIVVGGSLAALFVAFDRRKTRAALCVLAGGAGKLLWMERFRAKSYGLSAPTQEPRRSVIAGAS
jgi:succinoglycan biosynthesis protein ExoM